MNTVFFAQKQMPLLLLRLGLGTVLLYAAVSALVAPEDWIGYLPNAATDIVDGELLLRLFSIFQLVLVAWLASGRYLHIAGLVCAATFGGIVVTNTALLEITFRDVALTFAALALSSLAFAERRRLDGAKTRE